MERYQVTLTLVVSVEASSQKQAAVHAEYRVGHLVDQDPTLQRISIVAEEAED